MEDLTIRPRRLRGSDAIRRLARETRVSPDSLMLPLFVTEGENCKREIPSLPGQYHWSADRLPEAIDACRRAGVGSVMLFGLPGYKDTCGSGAWDEDGVVQRGIRAIKAHDPDFFVTTDVCLCEYTSHGHCGVLCGDTVDNDETLPLLARTAVSHVRAGADMVAPSDMMDGRVAAIRRALDADGRTDVPILSYSAKYASAFYGPFRDAAGSAPAFGDRRGYQMDPHNHREAIRECALDVAEGADMLMVKPALAYLDVLWDVRQQFNLPVAAYSVSGEYAMLKAAGAAGYLDEHRALCESAACIFRAGADILITYAACELAEAMKRGEIG